MNDYFENLGATDNYKVECVQAGQTRRYADSEYIYKVTDLNDSLRTEAETLAWCRKTLRDYPDKKGFLSPYLASFTLLNSNTWKYHVTYPYCD